MEVKVQNKKAEDQRCMKGNTKSNLGNASKYHGSERQESLNWMYGESSKRSRVPKHVVGSVECEAESRVEQTMLPIIPAVRGEQAEQSFIHVKHQVIASLFEAILQCAGNPDSVEGHRPSCQAREDVHCDGCLEGFLANVRGLKIMRLVRILDPSAEGFPDKYHGDSSDKDYALKESKASCKRGVIDGREGMQNSKESKANWNLPAQLARSLRSEWTKPFCLRQIHAGEFISQTKSDEHDQACPNRHPQEAKLVRSKRSNAPIYGLRASRGVKRV